MKASSFKLVFLFLATSLTACSSNFFQPNQTMPTHHAAAKSSVTENNLSGQGETVSSGAVAGNLEHSMDEIDKSKMFRALDKSPGKSTHWVNASTGISYTVVPTEKVEVNGNPYCRKYTTTATKDNREKQFGGTACVNASGGWVPVN